MWCVVGIFRTLAAFAVATCAFTPADAIENTGRVAISAPLDLSRETRPAPRPPIIVNAVPSALPAKNVASTQAQPLERAACTAKASQQSAASCRQWRNVPQLRPAS
jgi:hypothetical protein